MLKAFEKKKVQLSKRSQSAMGIFLKAKNDLEKVIVEQEELHTDLLVEKQRIEDGVNNVSELKEENINFLNRLQDFLVK